MKLLNGREIAEFIQERQAGQVRNLRQEYKIAPKLAIVLTIDHPVINVYMRMKKQYGADIAVDVDIHKVAQADAPGLIKKLNNDSSVHGIIVQLPLEDPSQTDYIVNLVDPKKDVDGLGNPEEPWPSHLDTGHGAAEERTEPYLNTLKGVPEAATQSSAKTTRGASGSAGGQASGVRGSWFDPATPMAILWLLAGYNVDLQGKRILLIGRGKLVGAPLERIFKTSGQDVVVADRSTKDLKAETLQADIIITAAGSPAILFPDMIKQKAVVVDAGVASEDGKTVGDLSAEVYSRDDLTLTPVKGGVGPLTVCALFENVIRAARENTVK